MSKSYAVLDTERNEILMKTPSFAPDSVSERIPLGDGRTLLIAGTDVLEAENADLRAQLSEALEANTAKEVFLSSMSHDIRTPMNAIVGMTALAKKHIDEKTRVLDSLNKIEVASAHLLNLINEVLDMSRINSGRVKPESELFSLSDLLHETLVIVRPQAQQKRHAFRFTVHDVDFESLYGDATRLKQIFVNIINNAIKYTNEGGEIAVDVSERTEGDRCVLCFRCTDNGVGMSKEFLQRIFDPFERANTSTISRIEGTGLGMSIVKKLVDMMSGTIGIDSAPSKGTEVSLAIPMRFERISVDADALSGKRLLIAESDEQQIELFTRFLNEFGVAHRIVPSASEAISALTEAEFQGSQYDAVLIGKTVETAGSVFDMASYLHKSNPALPLILVSEDNWDEIEYRASRSGISHFVPIPMFRKSLINSLSHVLSRTDGGDGKDAVPNLSGKHILLVEDNYINREIACELLGVTRAEVDVAEDGKQGVERFLASGTGYYDLILMDIQMPVMDGYEATRRIRSADRTDAQKVMICAMTANVFAEDIAKARDAGMNGHLAKPIDVNKLMHLLSRIF